MLPRWSQVEPLICEFQRLLAPNVPQLKIEIGIDCAAPPSGLTPALESCGVYLIFDESESLMYIGIAPERRLIDRVGSYRSKPRFPRKPRWIDVIPFDSEWLFFVPALELYLIDRITKLSPGILVNKTGTKHAEHRRIVQELLEEFPDSSTNSRLGEG
jgi:hypothetical protein